MAEVETIRLARDSELPILLGLYREAFELNFPQGNWRRVENSARFRIKDAIASQAGMTKPGGEVVLVAETAGEILGYIWWSLGWAPDLVLQATIENVVVVEAHRRTGVATKLMQAAMQWATRINQAKRISCIVALTNVAGLNLIEKMGGEGRFQICSRDFPEEPDEWQREQALFTSTLIQGISTRSTGSPTRCPTSTSTPGRLRGLLSIFRRRSSS